MHTSTPASHADTIRELNDRFRTTLTGGRVFMTAGIDALASELRSRVIERVTTFADFNPDNDPHGEHDFGSFELAGQTFFWKIDYYDRRLKYSSDDPADPIKTIRVLTIMLAEEY